MVGFKPKKAVCWGMRGMDIFWKNAFFVNYLPWGGGGDLEVGVFWSHAIGRSFPSCLIFAFVSKRGQVQNL